MNPSSESGTSPSAVTPGHVVYAPTPDAMFIEDVARVLRTSRSTIERRRRSGTFPIPELPAIDERPRWSRQSVERYLASTDGGLRSRRGRPRTRVQ